MGLPIVCPELAPATLRTSYSRGAGWQRRGRRSSAPRRHFGVQGLLSDGGSARTEAAAAAAASLGGSVEAFYFAFGSEDAFVVADLASNADAAALSLAVSASGAVNARVTVLLTPEELDAAAETVRNSVSYSPPGN